MKPSRAATIALLIAYLAGASASGCGSQDTSSSGGTGPSSNDAGQPAADGSSGSGGGGGASGDGGGGFGASSDAATHPSSGPDASSGPDGSGAEPNVLPITVNGSLCLPQQDLNINEPCTSVTICVPGTSRCQTISGILLDTGSTGLRLFGSVVTIPLPPVTSGAGTLAECESYSGGSADWGSLATADIVLAGEPAVTTAVHLIDSKFSKPTGPCDPTKATLDTDPASAGFNGILGISHHANDCDPNCSSAATSGYYLCTSSSCTASAATTELVNPIGLLPLDGNGYVVELPSVPQGGAPSVSGSVILGIGTRPNNTPGAVTVFPTATFGTIFGDFSSSPINSGTLDTGSSKYYFPSVASIPVCDAGAGSGATGVVCPASPVTITATMVSGSVQKVVTFEVDNGNTIRADTANSVFPGYAAAVADSDPYFMWGLPFFLGRTVYVAIDSKKTSIGTGPFWAF